MPQTQANEVELQFVRRFAATDWVLFKRMAEANLSEAAHLRRKDMHPSGVNSLLARNVRKRLLIGLGTELLLKALFLKAGYGINLPHKKSANKFPSKFEVIAEEQLQAKTATFDDCLKSLSTVVTLHDEQLTKEGLKIAKVFRNKEAHSVIEAHTFDPETYRTIETALRALYRDAFSEELRVTFAMTKDDKAIWKIKSQA